MLQNKSQVVLTASALGFFPVLYFFSFLYYTDVMATFFSLWTYLLTLEGKNSSSAAVAVFAIMCRQTNVIWVGFCACLCLGHVLLSWIYLDLDKKFEDRETMSDWTVLKHMVSLLHRSMKTNLRDIHDVSMTVWTMVKFYVMVGVVFVFFVIVNGSLVVGDTSNHQPCCNFSQLFHFLLVTAIFSFMHILSLQKLKNFIRFCSLNPLVNFAFFIVSALLIGNFTFVHIYNLADNRHYTFYFLAKLRKNPYTKFAFIPIYYYVCVTLWNALHNKDIFWKISYVMCTAAVIVPQRLLEFRYFIIPYLLLRLNMPLCSKISLSAELFFYWYINTVTINKYVHHTFLWPNSSSLQRFMW